MKIKAAVHSSGDCPNDIVDHHAEVMSLLAVRRNPMENNVVGKALIKRFYHRHQVSKLLFEKKKKRKADLLVDGRLLRLSMP